jgi:hypothetical protein
MHSHVNKQVSDADTMVTAGRKQGSFHQIETASLKETAITL